MGEEKNYIYGTRAVIEAIKSGKQIDKVLVKKGEANQLLSQLLQVAKDKNVAIQFVPVEKLNKINQKNNQGVIAFVSAVEYHDFDSYLVDVLSQNENPFILILDGVSDVRNFGAICRTAECAGVDAVLLPSKGAVRLNADAVKTSAGALHRLPVCRTGSLKSTVMMLQSSGYKIVAATEKTTHSYTDVDYSGPLAIVMGSEEKGVSKDVLRTADDLVKIPVLGKIESLNVSVAAGVLMYEAVKHRS